MKSDVARGEISYRFEFSEPYEGKSYKAAAGKGIVKFAEPGIGWRIGSFRAKDTGGLEWLWVTQAALSAKGLVLGISTRKPGSQLMWGKFTYDAKGSQSAQSFRNWFLQRSGPNDEVDASNPPTIGGWRNLHGWQVWLGGTKRGITYNSSPDLELWVPKYVEEHPA